MPAVAHGVIHQPAYIDQVTPMKVCAIVVAAGLSRRMGPGVQKLLLPYGGLTVLGHVVDQLLPAVDRVIVVVGQDPAVAAAISERPVTAVRNEQVGADMLSSVRCGLRALPAGCEAVLLVLGDQPSVTPGLIRQVIGAYESSGRGIVVPSHAARRGHPLLFSARYVPEVLNGYDGVGVRGLLEAHAPDVLELPVEDSGVATDMDVPEDYQRELARLARRQPPPSSDPLDNPSDTGRRRM